MSCIRRSGPVAWAGNMRRLAAIGILPTPYGFVTDVKRLRGGGGPASCCVRGHVVSRAGLFESDRVACAVVPAAP